MSTPDFTALAKKPSERLAIVAHVRDTATLEEADYLEWKSTYDLSSKPGAGTPCTIPGSTPRST